MIFFDEHAKTGQLLRVYKIETKKKLVKNFGMLRPIFFYSILRQPLQLCVYLVEQTRSCIVIIAKRTEL